MKELLKNKALLLKILIVCFGLVSLILMFTAKIYVYSNFSLKAFDIKLWLSIITWLLFMVLVVLFTIEIGKSEKNDITRVKLYIKNISLLLMITILLIYKIGNSILTIYELSNNLFNVVIYILFGTIFVAYTIVGFIIDKKYLGK